jgi:hypothetical protein
MTRVVDLKLVLRWRRRVRGVPELPWPLPELGGVEGSPEAGNTTPVYAFVMTLSETARSRLADVVELQPTKNGELVERWDVDSGSDVHHYLENELKEYYYRDENSLIRATAEAAELVDVEPGVTDGDDGAPTAVRVPDLQARIVDVVPEPDEEGKSVVAVLHALEDAYDVDTDTDAVRDGLQALKRKGVVEVVYTTVPTYRLAVDRGDLDVALSDGD